MLEIETLKENMGSILTGGRVKGGIVEVGLGVSGFMEVLVAGLSLEMESERYRKSIRNYPSEFESVEIGDKRDELDKFGTSTGSITYVTTDVGAGGDCLNSFGIWIAPEPTRQALECP